VDKSKLILGTVQFGLDYGISNRIGKIPSKEAGKILDHAKASGVINIDTAASYGDSEKVIGECISKNPNLDFRIISKLDLKSKSGVESLNASIERLGVPKLASILFHSYQDFHSNQDVVDQLLQWKGEKFDSLGVSVYSNEELALLADNEQVDLIQLPFNLLDNEKLRKKAIENCRSEGKEIHTRSAFLQGLFL
jgi:aryl-alcohol dehydrogenase-like predicted oxidoreductase